MIKVVSTPLNIVLAGMSGYLSSNDPFPMFAKVRIVHMLISSYCILVLLLTFPE